LNCSVSYVTPMPITFKVCPHKTRIVNRHIYSNEPQCFAKSCHDNIRMYNDNGFIQSVCLAYNQHHRLHIRPDDIWIAIITQLSLFVKTPFKTIELSNIDELYTIKSSNEHFIPKFSTTTQNDRLVCSLLFNHEPFQTHAQRDLFELQCGIPEVTLLGNAEDWIELRKKTTLLESFKLFAWADMLYPILNQFIHSFTQPDLLFWNRICSYHGGGSSVKYLSGWITCFCPFDMLGNWKGNERCKPSENVPGTFHTSYWPLIPTDHIPLGFLQSRVKLQGNSYKLFAGHRGIRIETLNTLQPNIEWALIEYI